MENIFVEFLPPWIETGLQPAFYDKESGTVLQQTARMYARVNMLIRMFNKLSKNTKTEIERFETQVNEDMTQYKQDINETVANYIEQFNELHDYVHDYFDNLDVQEEINNKLDEMAEDGTLQEIIYAYIQANVVWAFDTVADMKAATNLVDGSYARTLGYHEKNDGGGVLYKIRTKTGADTPDEMLLIALSDNALIAEAILDNEICPEMFGAYANGSSDDSTAVQKTLDLDNSVKFRTGKVYLCNSALTITKRKTIDFSFSTIKVGHSGVGLTIDMETEDVYSHKRFTPSIENLVIDCGNASKGIYIDYAYKGIINNIYINNFLNIGMEKQHGYELVLDNLYFWASNQNTTSIGLLVSGNDCEFGNIFGINCHTGVKITGGANHFKQIHMWLFNDTQGEGMADGDALYAGSAMIDVANNDRNFIDYAYVDSYQYGFKYTGYGYITLNSGFVYCPDLSDLTTDFLNYTFYFIYAEGDNINYLWRFTINNLDYQKSRVAGLTQKFIPDTYSKRPIRVTNSTIHTYCDNNKKDFIDCFTLNNCTNTNLHATYIGDDQIRIHGVLKKDSSASGWYISKPEEYIPIANNEVIICQTSASQYGSSSISSASINNGTNIAELSTTIPDNYYFIDVILRVIYQ